MMFTSSSSTTAALIQGPFDIAHARNMLRLKIAHCGWPLVFNVRAATILTVLGEFLLAMELSQPVLIRIASVEQPEKCGIELAVSFHRPEQQSAQWSVGWQALERLAEVEYHDLGRVMNVTISIWLK